VHAIKALGRVEVSLHPFLTWALDGGEWSAYTLRALALGTECLVPTEWEAEFARDPLWTFWRRDKSLALARNHTQVLWIMTSCF